jgi:hypothetical protein
MEDIEASSRPFMAAPMWMTRVSKKPTLLEHRVNYVREVRGPIGIGEWWIRAINYSENTSFTPYTE